MPQHGIQPSRSLSDYIRIPLRNYSDEIAQDLHLFPFYLLPPGRQREHRSSIFHCFTLYPRKAGKSRGFSLPGKTALTNPGICFILIPTEYRVAGTSFRSLIGNAVRICSSPLYCIGECLLRTIGQPSEKGVSTLSPSQETCL